MFLTGRAVRTAAGVLALAAVTLAGCTSKSGSSDSTATLDVTTMRGALLQASDIGPTWTAPDDTDDTGASADPQQQMVSICGGTTTPPSVPPGGQAVTADFEDSGDTGAQTLYQTALVFGDKTAANAAQTALRAVADNCPATQNVPQTVNADKSEPAYTETVSIEPLTQGSWTGFAVIRHKKYEPTHPSTADTAVAILTDSNVVLVDAYAIYRLNNASTAPGFDTDWQKLVGSVLQRVG